MNKDDLNQNSGEQKGFTYYYNRERRLKNAPESVRRAWEEGYLPKNRGFIKGLVGNPGSRSIFITIVILSALIVALTFLNSRAHSIKTDSFEAQIKAFLYEETVFVTLACESKDTIHEPLIISFFALDQNNNVVLSSEVIGIWEQKKLVARITFRDYSIKRVQSNFDIGETEVALIATVDRN